MGRMGKKKENNKRRGDAGLMEKRIKPRCIEIIGTPRRDSKHSGMETTVTHTMEKSQRKSHAYRLKGLIGGPRKTKGSVTMSISITVIFFQMCGMKEVILHKSRQTDVRLKIWNRC